MHKPVLITGASSGIGEATAVYLAHKGFKVFAAARSIDKLQVLGGLGGGRITPLRLDVNDDDSIKSAFEDIAGAGQPLFGLVNNAGISVTGPVEEIPDSEWRRQFDTNLFGLMKVTRAVLPQMRAAGEGRIVNIGSVAGRVVAPFMGAYGASKHAVEGVTDALRRELKPHKIKISLIRPGFINTSFGKQEQGPLQGYIDAEGPYARQVEIFKAWHAKGHPNGVSPNVVAEKVYHALTAVRPNSRYTAPSKFVGFLMLRNLLPSAIADRVFEHVIGLNRL